MTAGALSTQCAAAEQGSAAFCSPLCRTIFKQGHAVIQRPHSSAAQDDALFVRNFTQLKAYYTDLRGMLPASQQEFPFWASTCCACWLKTASRTFMLSWSSMMTQHLHRHTLTSHGSLNGS